MSGPSRLPVPRHETVRRITEGVIGGNWDTRSLALTIRLSDKEISARDFSAFLSLLDSAYGRMDPLGFLSYAHRPQDHLRITNTRAGSVELEVIREIVTHFDLWGMVIAYLAIKMGPQLLSGDAARNWGEAFQVWGNVLEQSARTRSSPLPAHLTRRQRGRLRSMISEDPSFKGLGRKDLDRLADALEMVLVREERQLQAVARFSVTTVKKIDLNVLDATEEDSSD